MIRIRRQIKCLKNNVYKIHVCYSDTPWKIPVLKLLTDPHTCNFGNMFRTYSLRTSRFLRIFFIDISKTQKTRIFNRYFLRKIYIKNSLKIFFKNSHMKANKRLKNNFQEIYVCWSLINTSVKTFS